MDLMNGIEWDFMDFKGCVEFKGGLPDLKRVHEFTGLDSIQGVGFHESMGFRGGNQQMDLMAIN